MKIKQAKEYFQDGMITGFCMIRDPLKGSNWLLVIEGHNERSWTFQTALGVSRSFASLDTLCAQIEDIGARGFSTLRVEVI